MVSFFVIIFFIVSLFYVFIGKYNIEEKYDLIDIANKTTTRIRGQYIDIVYNGESVRIIKEDGKCWYYKEADDKKKELKCESVFKVGDREFKIIRTNKRDSFFILIPLITTVLTILALFFQTDIVLENSISEDKIEQNNSDDFTSDESAAVKNEVLYPTENGDELQINEDNLSNNDKVIKDTDSLVEGNSDLFVESITIDWESFQQSPKQRRELLNNSSEMGIQVSKYQGVIEWGKVKADGIDFAIIQAGSRGYKEGGLNVDPYFKTNIDEATANGIKVGVSFHSQAINRGEIDEEIELIMKSVNGYDLKYPIGITLLQEENYRTSKLTFNEYIDLIKYFCICIEENGYTPMIMGEAEWFEQFSEGNFFDGYLKMVYDPNNPPSDINNCIIWIYTANSKGLINGINDDLVVAMSVSAYTNENDR